MLGPVSCCGACQATRADDDPTVELARLADGRGRRRRHADPGGRLVRHTLVAVVQSLTPYLGIWSWRRLPSRCGAAPTLHSPPSAARSGSASCAGGAARLPDRAAPPDAGCDRPPGRVGQPAVRQRSHRRGRRRPLAELARRDRVQRVHAGTPGRAAGLTARRATTRTASTAAAPRRWHRRVEHDAGGDRDEPPDTYSYSLDLTVDGPDGAVRVVAMHMPTPINNFEDWRRDLRTAAQIGRTADGPDDGDRRPQLPRTGTPTSARCSTPASSMPTRPTDTGSRRRGRRTGSCRRSCVSTMRSPTGGLVSTDVDDFEIPGSDHRGFVVTVAPTR